MDDPEYGGLVAKDSQSPYGGRTLSWMKVTPPDYREGERAWEPKRWAARLVARPCGRSAARRVECSADRAYR